MVKNPPANAGDAGSITDLGKSLIRGPQLLSLHSRVQEQQLLSPCTLRALEPVL